MSWTDDYIHQLNIICEDFGCEPGSDRLAWLNEELSKVDRLTARIEELEKALRYLIGSWDEFGPQNSFDEKVEWARSILLGSQK